MNDAYVECLVKQAAPPYAGVVKIGLIIVCAVSVLAALVTPLGIVAALAAGGICYLVFQNLTLEFEYLYINGQLTIDKIMGRTKRKKVWEGDLDQVGTVALADSPHIKHNQNDGTKRYDCSSKTPGGKVYCIIAQSGQNQVKILFEPSPEMLRQMRQKHPHKVQI